MIKTNYPEKCYAAWRGSRESRSICASGGLATALGEYVIGSLGGVVFGTRFDDGLQPVVGWTEDPGGLEAFKGSKYVRSSLGAAALDRLKAFLGEGRAVLFVGTPCQVAAVRIAVGDPGAYSGTLYAVDLLCHGVMPAGYLAGEVDFLKRRHSIARVDNVRFRGNDAHDFHFSLWDSGRCVYDMKGDSQPYLSAYLLGIGFAEGCYSCNYAAPGRVGDLTLGDFIGLGSSASFERPDGNLSFVAAGTSAGASLLEALASSDSALTLVPRPYSERLSYPYSLTKPFPRHRLDGFFRRLERRLGFPRAIRLTLVPVRLNSLYVKAKRKLGIKGSLRLPG